MDKLDLLKSHIEAYTKKDGTFVAAHDDKRIAQDSVAQRQAEIIEQGKSARNAIGAGLLGRSQTIPDEYRNTSKNGANVLSITGDVVSAADYFGISASLRRR